MKKLLAFTGALAVASAILFFGTTAFAQAQPSALPLLSTSEASDGSDADGTSIEAKVGADSYPDIVVEVGKSVSVNFKVDAVDLNACNNEIVIPELDIDKKLTAGDNIVTFTPTRTGSFTYSCWMGMLRATITVVEQGDGEVGATPGTESTYGYRYGGCPILGGGAGGYGSYGGGNSGGYRGGCCH